ncbi:MAG: hypothetical protein CSA33_05965 [Desulfobulbus propionicus]|nr:MAG: hypothetical protein CSA33_05965 [Desulfobulbus propionicus]
MLTFDFGKGIKRSGFLIEDKILNIFHHTLANGKSQPFAAEKPFARPPNCGDTCEFRNFVILDFSLRKIPNIIIFSRVISRPDKIHRTQHVSRFEKTKQS